MANRDNSTAVNYCGPSETGQLSSWLDLSSLDRVSAKALLADSANSCSIKGIIEPNKIFADYLLIEKSFVNTFYDFFMTC